MAFPHALAHQQAHPRFGRFADASVHARIATPGLARIERIGDGRYALDLNWVARYLPTAIAFFPTLASSQILPKHGDILFISAAGAIVFVLDASTQGHARSNGLWTAQSGSGVQLVSIFAWAGRWASR